MFSFSCHLTSFLMNVGEMLARCWWVNANGTNIVGQHVGQMLARCWRSLPRPLRYNYDAKHSDIIFFVNGVKKSYWSNRFA